MLKPLRMPTFAATVARLLAAPAQVAEMWTDDAPQSGWVGNGAANQASGS